MGLFCCVAGKYRYSPPPSPEPAEKRTKSPPPVNLLRRKSLKSSSRSKPQKHDIEAFYKEGKELLRAEREQAERENLRRALEEAYAWREEEDPFRGLSNTEEPYAPNNGPERAEVPEQAQSRHDRLSVDQSIGPLSVTSGGYSFETTTDRRGVRAKPSLRRKRTSDTIARADRISTDDREPLQETGEGSVASPIVGLGLQDYEAGSVRAEPPESPKLRPHILPSITSSISVIAAGEFSRSTVAVPTGFLPDPSPSEKPVSSGWATPEEYSGNEMTSDDENIGTAVPDSPAMAREQLARELLVAAPSVGSFVGNGAGPKKKASLTDLPPLNTEGTNTQPDGLIYRIPQLMRPSVSTFMSFGSQTDLRSAAASPPPVVHSLNRGFSLASMRKHNRNPSHGTIQRRSTEVRRHKIETASSFYPSDDSRPQSAQQSAVDIPNVDSMMAQFSYASELQQRFPVKPTDLASSKSNSLRGIASPGFSKFAFPWGEKDASMESFTRLKPDKEETPKMLRVAYQTAHTYHGRTQDNLLTVSQLRPRNPLRSIPGVYRSPSYRSSRMTSSGIGSDGSFATPVASDSVRTSATPTAPGAPDRPSSTPTSRSSWYAQTAKIPHVRERSESPSAGGLHRNNTYTGTPRQSKDWIIRPESTVYDEEGRFDNLVPTRSKSLTIRRTLSASMQKMREKVSLSVRSRHSLRSKRSVPKFDHASEIPPRTPEIPTKIDETEDEGPASITGGTMSRWRRVTSQPMTAAGIITRGNVPIRRSSTVHTTRSSHIRGSERKPRTPRRRTINTRYDDCVAVPFTDGHASDDEEDAYLPRSATFANNFLTDEYHAENRILEGMNQTPWTREDEKRSPVFL